MFALAVTDVIQELYPFLRNYNASVGHALSFSSQSLMITTIQKLRDCIQRKSILAEM